MTNKIEILRELIQTARSTLNAFTTIGVSFVSDGKIDSFNAFIGASERLCDNIINLI